MLYITSQWLPYFITEFVPLDRPHPFCPSFSGGRHSVLCSHLLVCFGLGFLEGVVQISYISEIRWYLSLSGWLILLGIISSRSIYTVGFELLNDKSNGYFGVAGISLLIISQIENGKTVTGWDWSEFSYTHRLTGSRDQKELQGHLAKISLINTEKLSLKLGSLLVPWAQRSAC